MPALALGSDRRLTPFERIHVDVDVGLRGYLPKHSLVGTFEGQVEESQSESATDGMDAVDCSAERPEAGLEQIPSANCW